MSTLDLNNVKLISLHYAITSVQQFSEGTNLVLSYFIINIMNVTLQLDKFGIKSNVEGTMLVCLIWLVVGNEKQTGN